MEFDIVILGTGLTESIAAAALSKAGFTVAHLDANPYYGGDEASLTLDEIVQWADQRARSIDAPKDGVASSSYLSAQRARFTSISRSSSPLPSQSRQYSLSLAPTIIPSIGPLIDSLVASGVSRYGGFKLLEKVAIFEGPGSIKEVPGSKEHVFKNKDLSLLDKRRLMRFLMFAAGEFEGKKELEAKEQMPFVYFLRDTFSLDHRTADAIAYALAFCVSPSDPTLPALQRVRRYLRSTGRYGPSPFLVGHYGGIGEIAQGFCRTSAVNGTTYILGRQISFLEVLAESTDVQTVESSDNASSPSPARRYKLKLEDLTEELTCDLIVSAPDYLPPEFIPRLTDSPDNSSSTDGSRGNAIARCIAIVDRPITFSPSGQAPDDTSLPVDEGTILEQEEQEQTQTHDHIDTALLVFPPSSLPGGSATVAVNVLVTGEGSMSAPRGKWVWYISMPLLDETAGPAEDLLRPYLDATMSLTLPDHDNTDVTHNEPLFSLFYIDHSIAYSRSMTDPPDTDERLHVLVPPASLPALPEVADLSTTRAEAIFWSTVGALEKAGRRPRRQEEKDSEEGVDSELGVGSFWPPLDAVDDPSEDW